MDIDRMGKVAAKFQAKEEGISGLVVSDNEDTRTLLADHMGLLASTIQENGAEAVDVRCAIVPDLDLNRFAKENESTTNVDEQETDDSYEIQTARLYNIAESFISLMKEIS